MTTKALPNADEVVAYLVERLTDDGKPLSSSLRFLSEPEGSNVRVTALVPARSSRVRAITAAKAEERAACAQLAESDVDWTRFAIHGLEPWENGADDIRDYRLGINTGRVIAAAIRRRGEASIAEA